jgi:tol-pal system protein YbgF
MILRSARAAMCAALGLAGLLLVSAAPPARAQEADLVVRVNRLENQVRQLSGQIEQLQFQNGKLQEQLTKFQQDVEYRFQEMKGGARPSAAAPAPAGGNPAPAKPQKRSDAFDPAAQPTAPGAPRTLGNLGADGAPVASAGSGDIGSLIDDEEDGPMDLNSMGRSASSMPSGALPAPGLPPQAAVSQGLAPQGTAVLPNNVAGTNPRPVGSAGLVTGTAPSIAAAASGSPRDSYDLAYGLVLQRQYEQAEMAFRQFLQAHPRDKLVPDATYWLGETYYRRARYPDAVEQYLKIYKTFGTSRVAPESMLKLSLSLRGMKQPEQACATLAEIGRKYPDASAEVKAGVQREQKRGSC